MNDSAFTYTYFPIPGLGEEGPYRLDSWTVDDEVFMAEFDNIGDLVDSMNVFDTIGVWTIDRTLLTISCGFTGPTYGPLSITQINTGATATLEVNTNLTPNGTSIRIPIGTHQVVVNDPIVGCSDTLNAVITCRECPEVYTGPLTVLSEDCEDTKGE